MMTHVPVLPMKLLSCEAARPLAARVAAELNTELVPTHEVWFACGEGKIEIGDNVRGSNVYIFQSVAGPGDGRSLYDRTMMMLHAVEAATLSDAADVTAVLPYFPGARQDKRKGRTREGISAGLMARCLQAAGARRVLSVEVHNDAIAGMFQPAHCRLENLSLEPRLSAWLRDHGLAGDIVAAPDVGGLERARTYASDLQEGLAVLSKIRDYDTPNRIVSSTLIGDVDGKDVLLVDDIIDTAGSVIAAVDRLKEGGARHVTVAAAHPVFSDPAIERMAALADRASAEGWRFVVVGTTSVEHTGLPSWYQPYDLAPMLAQVIASINNRASVTNAHC